jgi:hypothetical protein
MAASSLVSPELAENDSAKLRDVQRRRSQRDQRLAPRLLELLAGRQRDPLRQHREGTAGLLELRQSAPLALKHRQRCRVERIAGLEPAAQKIPCLGLGRGGIDGRPLGRELVPTLEAPIGVIAGDPLPHALVADILEQYPFS